MRAPGMLDALLSLLRNPPPATADTVGAPFPRRELAVAALLLEVAQCDRSIGAQETAAIQRIVTNRLGPDVKSAADLITAARTEFDASLDDWIFATAVRESFDLAERIAIVGQMWELVYADGQLDRLEEAVVLRLAEELGVMGDDLEAARAQAFARDGDAVRGVHGE
jgi:uncharacterized tellurite resistance protein B-like protein